MADIVVDTSAILAVLLSEPERTQLIAVTAGATLCVPPSVPWEVGNALASLIKQRRLTALDARRIVRSYERIPLREVGIDLGRAVQTAAELGLYAYDAYLLEAARVRQCGLLTLDRTLTRAAQAAKVSVIEVPR
jgi:predicted nucleic acid-binding protein